MANTLEFIIAYTKSLLSDLKEPTCTLNNWCLQTVLYQTLEKLKELQDLKQNFSVLGSRLDKAEREKEALRLDNQELEQRLAQSELRLREAEKRNTALYQETVELNKDLEYVATALVARAQERDNLLDEFLEEKKKTKALQSKLAFQKAVTAYWKRLFSEKEN